MQAPKIPSFVKLPKHKQFNIKPRYYNPEEEARKKRLEELQSDQDDGSDNTQKEVRAERMRSQMNRNLQHRKKTTDAYNSSKIRLIIIIVILLTLIYFILKY